MPGSKGNRNALRHGLYAKHFTPEIIPELRRMPTDDITMELHALRVVASQALDYLKSCTDPDKIPAAIQATVKALEAAANAVVQHQLLSGNAPVLQSLWDAIEQVNADECIDVTI